MNQERSEPPIPPTDEPNPYAAPPPAERPPYGPEPPQLVEQDKDARLMGMLCHLTGLSMFVGVPSFIGPLIIWLVKKDDSAFVDDQGKESLNFQLTMLIAYVVTGAIAAATCGLGIVLVIPIPIIQLVFCLIGTFKANEGQYYRYPMTIRMVT